jgi:O-methyltransferase
MGALGKIVGRLPLSLRRRVRAVLMPGYQVRLALAGNAVQQIEWEGRYRFYTSAFRMLQFNKIKGDYAEFGCHGAATFGIAYYSSLAFPFQRHLWAFDSFAGLPPAQNDEDRHPMWRAGSMATDVDTFLHICELRAIPRDAYTIVPGYYSESLATPPKGITHPGQVALAYVDCDMYSSTMDVLHFLMPRLAHGSILAFDDYYCMSDSHPAGERRAFNEIFSGHARWNVIPFMQFPPMGMSFVLEDRACGLPPCGSY